MKTHVVSGPATHNLLDGAEPRLTRAPVAGEESAQDLEIRWGPPPGHGASAQALALAPLSLFLICKVAKPAWASHVVGSEDAANRTCETLHHQVLTSGVIIIRVGADSPRP